MEKIKCYKCGYQWDYTGNSKKVICCDKCKYNLYISKLRRIKEGIFKEWLGIYVNTVGRN